MIKIEVEINDRGLRNLFSRLSKKLSDLTPAMKSIGELIRSSVVRNFELGGRPPWRPSKKESGKTLIRTGRLMNSITCRPYFDKVTIGTNVKYGAIHQLGGRTGPHEIRPRFKRALFWPGARHPVKKVSHPGSTIPPRPFLAVQKEDWDDIRRIVERHVSSEVS